MSVNQARSCFQGTPQCYFFFSYAKDILRSLPTQTTLFESGRFQLRGKSQTIFFSKPFPEQPRIMAWMTKPNNTPVKLLFNQTLATKTELRVSLPEAEVPT